MSADRLSTLLHELDDLPVAPPPASAVRARGTALRRRRQGAAGAGLLGLAALGVVGVGALSGPQDTSLRPAPVASAPALPDPAPAALPDEGDPDVSDGVDLGHVDSVAQDGGGAVLVLDRVDWLEQDEVRRRYVEQGLDPAEAVDHLVLDEVEDLHRYPVSPDVAITLTVGLAPPDLQGGSVPASLDELRALLADPALRTGHLFELTVEDGVVVRIDHRYVS